MSIIRADSIKNRAGDGAPDFPNGITVTGIVTATTLNNVANNIDVDDFISVGNNIHLGNAGVCTATSFSGSGASLTSLPAGNLTGALPAISGANLTGVGAGKLLKIHHATTNTSTTITTPTRADTGLTVTFTPEALGSTFYVLAQQFGLNGVSSDQALFNLYLMRSIAGGTATELEEWHYLGNFTTNDRAYHCSVLGYLDSPSYSSGQTLNYHIEVGFYTGNYNLNYSAQNGQLKSTIFVYEMGA